MASLVIVCWGKSLKQGGYLVLDMEVVGGSIPLATTIQAVHRLGNFLASLLLGLI
jgi:hypothetical protein